VDVESISSNKELSNSNFTKSFLLNILIKYLLLFLTDSSVKASRKKNLKVKLVFPSRLKRLLNTRRSATAAKTSNLSQVIDFLKHNSC